MSPVLELNDELHMSSCAWRSQLWRKTKVQKHALFRIRAQFPVAAYVTAVVEMQRIWRGILLRRRVLARYLHKNFKRLWRAQEEKLIGEYAAAQKPEDVQFLQSLKRVQARLRTCLLRREYVRWLAYEKHSVYFVAACTMQRTWRNYKFMKYRGKTCMRYRQMYLTREDACAARIQNAWRSYVNKQIYHFYVDLIKFRERGDPQLMLKCVNPREASLADAASGLHVRFRLGGSSFPPTIFYKIFCHSPVQDIGAFAPKDYVDARRALPTPAERHNKKPVAEVDKSKWYKRDDNNQWRCISEKVLQDAEAIADEPAYEIPKSAPWHHTKLKRKEEVNLKVKRRRREWLKQLYTQEQMTLTTDEAAKAAVIRDAAALFDSMTDNEFEEEVERLVQWTKDLDYKTYRQDWLLTATTAGSDFSVDARPPLQATVTT